MDSSGREGDSGNLSTDTREFFFDGTGRSALLIHGLTGTPYDMRYLGERLAACGMRVCGVRLAGHAASPEELGGTTRNHWYESVVTAFERIRAFGDPVAIVGQSMGAVLAARLAADQGEAVAGLVMLAPAFFLYRWAWFALGLLRWLGPLTKKIYLKASEHDLHDAAARRRHPGTTLMPLSAPIGLYELAVSVTPRLSRVTQPTLIIHSRRDHTCPLANVDFLLRHLGGTRNHAVILDESFHIISIDCEKSKVADEVLKFLESLSGGANELRSA